jgi:hypothetical protein
MPSKAKLYPASQYTDPRDVGNSKLHRTLTAAWLGWFFNDLDMHLYTPLALATIVFG